MKEIVGGILLLFGSLLILVSAIGIIKMPDLYMRMSATTKASTLGVGCIMLGTALFWESVGITARVLVIVAFLMTTAPIAAHLIARAAYLDDVPLWPMTKIDELKGKYNKDTHELS
jgi:multicomponent Na+:H+ antiporter subunit G